jgi:hypothetical protein
MAERWQLDNQGFNVATEALVLDSLLLGADRSEVRGKSRVIACS